MRASEYVLPILGVLGSLLVLQVATPEKWSQIGKTIYRIVITAFVFVGMGVYWLAMGEKLDETIYIRLICPLYSFDECKRKQEAATAKSDSTTQDRTKDSKERDRATSAAEQQWTRVTAERTTAPQRQIGNDARNAPVRVASPQKQLQCAPAEVEKHDQCAPKECARGQKLQSDGSCIENLPPAAIENAIQVYGAAANGNNLLASAIVRELDKIREVYKNVRVEIRVTPLRDKSAAALLVEGAIVGQNRDTQRPVRESFRQQFPIMGTDVNWGWIAHEVSPAIAREIAAFAEANRLVTAPSWEVFPGLVNKR